MASKDRFGPFQRFIIKKLKSLIKNIPNEIKKVFLRLRPQEPKLPSSGQLWGVALFKRYPGVCRVYAIIMLVFEQIPEYCGHLRPFLAFLKINFLKLKSLIKNFQNEIEKVFPRLRPQEPKLPSSGNLWMLDLFKRYPRLCRVYAHLMLVFDQIPEYFGL